MKNNKLKRLSRKELTELVLLQKERIEKLEEEVLEKDKALNDRKIKIENSGSLAEAIVKLSGIFEEADKIKEEYLYNIQESCKKKKTKVTKKTKRSINKGKAK